LVVLATLSVGCRSRSSLGRSTSVGNKHDFEYERRRNRQGTTIEFVPIVKLLVGIVVFAVLTAVRVEFEGIWVRAAAAG
jgi:hypothetical protein